MIDATEIDMYPALLVHDIIQEGIKNFIPQYIKYSDDHAKILVSLMRLQTLNMRENEEETKLYWELIEGSKINLPVRF